jgi:gliding motility-associated-like protein
MYIFLFVESCAVKFVPSTDTFFTPYLLGKATMKFLQIIVPALSFFWMSTQIKAQKGKDGAETITTNNAVLNRYATLAANAQVGDQSVNVVNIADLSGSAPIAGGINPYAVDPISKGDLFLIIQVQGATINAADASSWGGIIDYNNTGNYEIKEITNVVGNTLFFCPGLQNSYSTGGNKRSMVVRIPRLTTLIINSNASISSLPWNGNIGGIVALESDGDITVNGSIHTNGQGFRGGTDINNKIFFGKYNYVFNDPAIGGGKGESIAGNETDYQNFFGGAYGRGAPANGGGGGNPHNSGGGGGANAATNGQLNNWNGSGIKENRTSPTNWTAAWDLEALNFSSNISPGGGRGGYTYLSADRDAITEKTDNPLWKGDYRRNIGGFGGRPLDYSQRKLFMGGGGGSGEGNNNAQSGGGKGGGIIFIVSFGNVNGSGSVSCKGNNGFDTKNSMRDGTGGAGGGGAILILSKNNIDNIEITADGGSGGNQIFTRPYMNKEAEGPGGGGGGGYIGTTPNTNNIKTSVTGGTSGKSESKTITEFTPNGATAGAEGLIDKIDFGNYQTNTFSKLIDTTICIGQSYTLPDGTVTTQPINKTYSYSTISGCDSIISVNLKVTPVINKTLFPVICIGDSYTLPYTGTKITAPGKYVDIGKLPSDFCDTRATIYLTVKDTSAEKVYATICTGSSYVLPDGRSVNTTGVYLSTYKSIFGCDSNITTTLNIADSIKLSLYEFICEGKTLTLPNGSTITQPGNYPFYYKAAAGCDSIVEYNVLLEKNAADTLDIIICKDSAYKLPNDSLVRTTGVYTAIIPSSSNCDSIITIRLTVAKDNESLVRMPTVFTPNNDGLNDLLKVKGVSKGQLESFSIYDRWGNLLFTTNAVDIGWDGKLKGISMPIGVYVYLIRAKDCKGSSRLFKGTVGIVK